MTLEELQKQLQAQGGLGGTNNTGSQPVGVNGSVSPTNANPQLVTRGAGQFTSVDDYLDKTGQRAINDANRLASLDSQKYAQEKALEPNVGPMHLADWSQFIPQSFADREAYMFDNSGVAGRTGAGSHGELVDMYREAMTPQAQYDAVHNDDEFKRLSAKMQQSGANYSRSHPTEYASATDAVDDYTKTIAQMETDARAFASRFGAEGSQAYNAAYAMKTSQDEGYNQLVAAREAAMKDSEQEEEDKRIRELFGDDKTDIETLRVMYHTIMDAQKRDNEYSQTLYAGSGDTMFYDNSYNQTHDMYGNYIPPRK